MRSRRHENIETVLLLAKLVGERKVTSKCEGSLKEFVRASWPSVEPAAAYVHGWHIDAICEHLEAVMDGQIRKLLINIPPRSTKSTVIAVDLPAWRWILKPEMQWLFTSYDLKLSKRDSRKCRALIKSAWYQQYWGSKFAISRDQDEKHRFENDKGGYRLATSVDAGTTGEGAHCIVYDDLNDVGQMTHDSYIEMVINYHEQVMSSRLHDPKRGSRISIQQRSSERDITGHILSKEFGWEHLVIPMEYEGKRKATGIGWTDPRTVEGELMCPERMGPKEVADMKVALGPVGYAGQFQQRPSPGEGAKFKREWWRFWNPAGVKPSVIRIQLPGGKVHEVMPVEIPPAFEQGVLAWDMAFKEEKDSDLVAGHAWGRVGANVFLIERVTGQMDFPKTIAAFRKMSEKYPFPEKLVEDKANGPAVIQTLRNEIPGLIPSPIQGGLESLATSSTGYAEAGNIHLPNPDLFPWVWDLIEQFANYPRGRHDDDVAAAAHAWRRLFDSISNTAAPEFRVTPRPNEPQSACHVETQEAMRTECQPHWRRWVAMAPGAALWLTETPSKAIRVYRELNLHAIDAHESGRRIAAASLPDVRDMMAKIHAAARWNCDIVMEKLCFAPIEPIGCYAELLAEGAQSYQPDRGEFWERESASRDLKRVMFSAEMAELEDGAWDRLRELLRFAPPEFQPMDYDRTYALDLYRRDPEEYRRYMSAVQGEVYGEYPKIKFSNTCQETLAALGTAHRDKETTSPFLRALLLGVTVQETVLQPQLKEIPWVGNGPRAQIRGRGRRRFALAG